MATTNTSGGRRPEKKFGPFAGGTGVAIWMNTVESSEGPRQLRSITIAPRRYFDRESKAWKDASSFRPSDLAGLIFGLQKAQEYVYSTAALGDEANEEFDSESF